MVMKDKTFMSKASQITSLKEKWATLDSKEMELQWKCIHWPTIQRRVNKLQSRITKAVTEGKKRLAKKLQYLLTNSFFAKLLAVRKVTTNRGKNTPGIDKRVWSTSASKLKGALTMLLTTYSDISDSKTQPNGFWKVTSKDASTTSTTNGCWTISPWIKRYSNNF